MTVHSSIGPGDTSSNVNQGNDSKEVQKGFSRMIKNIGGLFGSNANKQVIGCCFKNLLSFFSKGLQQKPAFHLSNNKRYRNIKKILILNPKSNLDRTIKY